MTMKLAAATAALLAAFAAPALADGPRIVHVAQHYEIRVAADATSAQESVRLVEAMRVAAQRVCRGVSPRVKRDACEDAAITNATRGVNPDLRSAIERARVSEPTTLFADNR